MNLHSHVLITIALIGAMKMGKAAGSAQPILFVDEWAICMRNAIKNKYRCLPRDHLVIKNCVLVTRAMHSAALPVFADYL